MQIIVIYYDGNFVVKPNLDIAFGLPGSYYVFSVGERFDLSQSDGICYYNKSREVERFRIEHLEIVDVEYVKVSNLPRFLFSIYNHKTNSIKKIIPTANYIPNALCYIVKAIILASNDQNWNAFDLITSIDEYKSEIKSLSEQIDILKKQNLDLTRSLNTCNKQT